MLVSQRATLSALLSVRNFENFLFHDYQLHEQIRANPVPPPPLSKRNHPLPERKPVRVTEEEDVAEVTTVAKSLRRIVRFVTLTLFAESQLAEQQAVEPEEELVEQRAAKQQEVELSVQMVRGRPHQTLTNTTASLTATTTQKIVVVGVRVVVCDVHGPLVAVITQNPEEEPVQFLIF